jgi:hypothetical protein
MKYKKKGSIGGSPCPKQKGSPGNMKYKRESIDWRVTLPEAEGIRLGR